MKVIIEKTIFFSNKEIFELILKNKKLTNLRDAKLVANNHQDSNYCVIAIKEISQKEVFELLQLEIKKSGEKENFYVRVVATGVEFKPVGYESLSSNTKSGEELLDQTISDLLEDKDADNFLSVRVFNGLAPLREYSLRDFLNSEAGILRRGFGKKSWKEVKARSCDHRV